MVLRLPSDSGYVVAYAAAAKLGPSPPASTPGWPPNRTCWPTWPTRGDACPTPPRVAGLERAGRDLLSRSRAADLDPDPERRWPSSSTSGTTGTPKGGSLRAPLWRARLDTGGAWGEGPGPPCWRRQFAHIGFTTKLVWYLRLATRTHVLGHWRARGARTVAAERMPSIGGVAQLAAHGPLARPGRHDWSHVRTVVVGGAASPPALVSAVRERFGADYSIRCSSTESGCGTGTAFDADDGKPSTVGSAPPGRRGVGARRGRPPGPPRCRWASCGCGRRRRCPATGGTRWPRPPPWSTAGCAPATWPAWTSGAGPAGGPVDRDVHPGRLQRLPGRGGGHPRRHPAVADVAVVPRPDPVMGEVGVAVVIARDPAAPPTLDDVRSFLTGRIAAYKLPEALRIVDGR